MENNLQEVYDKVIDLGNLSEETKEEKKPKKLTSEEVKLITETLNNVVEQNANLKVIADLPSNNGVSESENDLKGEDKVVTVNVNPVTNEKTVVGTTEEDDNELASDMFEDILDGELEGTSIEDIDFREEVVREGIKDKFDTNFKDEEVIQMMNLLNTYRKDKSIDVFNRLPKKLQQMITAHIAKEGIPFNTAINIRKAMARELLDDLIMDISIDNYQIEFNEELDKIFGDMKSEIRGMTIKNTKDQISQLTKVEPELREKDPEKADRLLLIIDGMNNSFSFEKLSTAIKEKKIGRIRKIDLEKPKKIYDKFNRLYETSVYNIYNMNLLPDILKKALPEDISDEKIHRFLISFCKYCENNNYHPDVLEEHSFMYYTVLNIVLLSLGTKSVEEDEYAKEITDNIIKVMDLFE